MTACDLSLGFISHSSVTGLAFDFTFFVGFDCSVFTCMFCYFIWMDCSLLFYQDHIDQCRDIITFSIMKNCAIE